MKKNFEYWLFEINFHVIAIFIFFLVGLVYGPSLTNLFYLIFFIFFIHQLYTKQIIIKFNFNTVFIIQCIFCLYLILNSYFITNESTLFYKSLFYFRFLLVAFIISKIIKDNDHTFKFICLIFLLFSIFLSLDIIYQSQTGFDIFGYQAGLCVYPDGKFNPNDCERFSGFFGDEYIAGNFLTTYGIFFLYFFFNKIKKNIFNIFLLSLSFILIIMAIMISGERNAFLSILLILFFNALFNKKLRKNIIYLIFIFLLILPFAFKKFKHIKYRYVDWPMTNISSHSGNTFQKLLQTPWGAHYVTAYDIFIDNKIFGSGYKSFRNECRKDIYDYKTLNKKYNLNILYSGCSSHPHNMYIELLSETGLIGFTLFFILFYFIILKPYFKNINHVKNRQDVIFALSIIFCILFPLRPTGSFSATVFSSNIWFFVGFYLYFINNIKYKK